MKVHIRPSDKEPEKHITWFEKTPRLARAEFGPDAGPSRRIRPVATVRFDGDVCRVHREGEGTTCVRSIELENGERIRLGDDTACDLVLPNEAIETAREPVRRRLRRTRGLLLAAAVIVLGGLAIIGQAVSSFLSQQRTAMQARLEQQRSAFERFVTQSRGVSRDVLGLRVESEAARAKARIDEERATVERLTGPAIQERRAALGRARAAGDSAAVSALERELRGLEVEIGRAQDVPALVERWSTSVGPSLLLLLCSFDYVFATEDGPVRVTHSEWATGFFVSEDGRIATSKRLVHPWKFDPRVAVLLESGGASIDESSHRLVAWPVGEGILDDGGLPDRTAGFSTDRGDLRLYALAPDSWTERGTDVDGAERRVRVHAHGRGDLAVLRAKVTEPTRPLPLRKRPCDPFEVVGAVAVSRLDAITAGAPTRALARAGRVYAPDEVLAVSPFLAPGHAGAPVVDTQGRVVGICTGVVRDSRGICLPARTLAELLGD